MTSYVVMKALKDGASIWFILLVYVGCWAAWFLLIHIGAWAWDKWHEWRRA